MSVEREVYYNKILGGTGCILEELYEIFIKENANIEKLFPIKSKVLDLGCGDGGCFDFLSKRDNSVFGVELSLYALKSIDKKNNRELIADFSTESAPFLDNTFDYVYINEVLEHLINPYAFIKEAKRVCKNNGIFHITIPNFSLQFQGYSDNQHAFIYPGLFTKENFSIFLKQMYLELLEKIDFNHPRTHIKKKDGTKIDALHHYFICRNLEIKHDIVEVVSGNYTEEELYE